jgi:hypothetical protein
MKKREPLSAPGYTVDQNGDVHIDHGAALRALRMRPTPLLHTLLTSYTMMMFTLFMPHIALMQDFFDSGPPL